MNIDIESLDKVAKLLSARSGSIGANRQGLINTALRAPLAQDGNRYAWAYAGHGTLHLRVEGGEIVFGASLL